MHWLEEWQTLVAGFLGLAGGVVAFYGALKAANRQVAAVRQAASDQVNAVQEPLEDARAARKEIDNRGLSIIKWAVRAEAMRLEAAVLARKDRALPSGPQRAARNREQYLIASSALLRGEREDMSLLDDWSSRRGCRGCQWIIPSRSSVNVI
jgi:hypothetical protein